MTFEWIVHRSFEDSPEKEYINSCCIGCDEILSALKPEIAARMALDEKSIEIYQEDWGWALEFAKENIIYLLALSNANEPQEDNTLFIADVDAFKLIKKLFFKKRLNDPNEEERFSKIVSTIAKERGFTIS